MQHDRRGGRLLSLSLSLSANYFVVHPSSYPSILPFPSPLSFQSSLFIRYRGRTQARGQLSVYRTCGHRRRRELNLFIIDSKSASYMGNEKALHMLDPLDLSLSLFAQEGRNPDMEDLRPSASIWHGLQFGVACQSLPRRKD